MTETIATLAVDITANTRPFSQGLAHVETELRGAGSRLSTMGNQVGAGIMQGLGISMGFGIADISARVVGLGVDVLELGVAWESAFAGVEKTVDGTTAQLAALENQLLGLSMSDSPVAGLENAAVQLAGIAEMAGQLGVARQDIAAFTETIGLLQMTTNLAGEEGAAMLAQFANIVNMDMSNIDRLGATIVALGNAGASTETQIVEFAHRLAGAGAQAGMTEAEILALGSAMASAGLNAEAGGTAMTTVFNKLAMAAARGGTALDTFAKVSGTSAQNFADTWKNEPTKALTMFLEGLSNLDQATQLDVLEQLELDGIRVSDTLRRLSGNVELVESSLSTANTAWEENSALMTEAEKRAATTAAQWEMLKNKLKGVATIISGEILPLINMSLQGWNMMASDIAGALGFDLNLDTADIENEIALIPDQIRNAVAGGFSGETITIEQGIEVVIPAGSNPWQVWSEQFSDQFSWEEFRQAAMDAASAAGFSDLRSIPAGFAFTINAQGDLVLVGGETSGAEQAIGGMTTQMSNLTAAAQDLLGGAFGQIALTTEQVGTQSYTTTLNMQAMSGAFGDATTASAEFSSGMGNDLTTAEAFANSLAYVADNTYKVYTAFGNAVISVDMFANETRDVGEGLISQLGQIRDNADKIPGVLANIVTEAGNMTVSAGLAAYESVTASIEKHVNAVLSKLPGINDIQIRLPDGLSLLSSTLGTIAGTVSSIVSGLSSIAGSGGSNGSLSGALSNIAASATGAGSSGTNGRRRAAGGPVVSGETYLVGEEGPELFTPGTSGQIIANHDLAGWSGGSSSGGGLVINIDNVHVSGVNNATEIYEQIVDIARTKANPGFSMERY